MAEEDMTIICTHCNKEIKGKVRLIGFAIICPYCERPCEDLQKEMNIFTQA